MIEFQYFPNSIKDSAALGFITMDQFININRYPKPKIENIFNKIQECQELGDMAGKDKYKAQLYSFTPCVRLAAYRRYDNIISFTGLLVLDFDKIHNAEDFKQFLIDEYNFIHACWISPSKKGVKALVQIPKVQSVDEFKSYYFGIAEEMQQYNGFDGSGQNSVLPLYQSMDKDIYYNPFSYLWNHKGYRPSDFTKSEPVKINYTGEKKEELILKIIRTGINKIVDNGHPQLRGVCLAVGGYIATGYIDFTIALSEVYNLIESNGYLQKGISGYKRTAKQMIEFGMSKPLYL